MGRFLTAGLWFAALLASAGLMFAGCTAVDDDDAEEAEKGIKITGVSLTPSPGSVARGGYTDFTAMVTGLDFTVSPDGAALSERDKEVTWSLTGAGAEMTVITTGGRLIVAESETAGTLTVKAESAADKTKYGTSEVAVSRDVAAVTGIAVTPQGATVAPGGTLTLAAFVTGTNSPDPRVTWSIEESDIKVKTVISSDGVLVVDPDETAGTLTVRAASLLDPTKFSTATVIIGTESATVESVTVTPASVSVAPGGVQTFKAIVSGKNSPAQTVVWSVLEAGRNDGTDITPEGKLIVSRYETLTALTVKAVSKLNPDKSGTALVTVGGGSDPAEVTGVIVSPETATVERGYSAVFTATVYGTGDYSQAVTWSVAESNKNAATVIVPGSASGTGVLTVAPGEALSVLTVRATASGGISGTAVVTVGGGGTAPAVTGVTVSPNSATVVKGTTQRFSAVVTGTGGTPSQTVTWSVSGGGNGTGISADGLLTVAASESATGLTVTAASGADTTKSGTAAVTVISNDPASHTVMFESGGGTAISNQPVQDGGKVTKPADPVRNGYTFAGWYKDSGLSAAWNFATDTVTADITLWAKWTVITYSITYNADGGSGTLSPTSYTIESPAIALPSLTKSGYTFGGWYDNSGFSGSAVYIIPQGSTGDKTFWAKWTAVASVTVTVSPYSIELATGGTCPFNATVSGTSNQAVTWSIDQTGKKAATVISGSGVLTVASDETLPLLTVRATSAADTSKSGTASVTVTGGGGGTPQGDINLSDPPAGEVTGSKWDYAPGTGGGVYTIRSGAAVGVTGSTTSDRLIVAGTATVTLNSASSILSGTDATPVDLADGANVTLKLNGASTLTASGSAAGIRVTTGRTLTITSADGNGQTGGTLIVTGGWSGAGIGGSQGEDGGSITIAGGSVYAQGYFSPASDGIDHHNPGAGIGGGGCNDSGGNALPGDFGTIRITGGYVEATGGGEETIAGEGGAGIGGGGNASGVSTALGSVTITGGTVKAQGGMNSAGIGGGGFGGQTSGTIMISGGTVTATGAYGAAGIGGGNKGAGGTIEISGSAVVTATGGVMAAGIGGGYSGEGGAITITDGTVFARGGGGNGEPAAIGGGGGGTSGASRGSAGTIRIEGGVVAAFDGIRSSTDAGVGASKSITITGGTVISGGDIGLPSGKHVGGIGVDSDEVAFSGNPVVFTTLVLNSAVYSGAPSTVLVGSSAVTIEPGTSFPAGTVTLNTDLTIPAGSTLTVPVGWTLDIPSGITLQNNGTIINKGTINGTVSGNQPQS